MPKRHPEKQRQYLVALRTRRKREAFEQYGNCCKVCGDTQGLVFDHIDPSTKSARMAVLWSCSQQRIEEELRKCQLLCRKCHKAKTARERQTLVVVSTPAQHGNRALYRRGCRCNICVDGIREKRKRWNAAYSRKRKTRQESRGL